MILDIHDIIIIDEGIAFMDSNCIICLEQYEIGQRLIILPCDHEYHEQCIKTWLNEKNRCPLCNRQFQSMIYYQKNSKY